MPQSARFSRRVPQDLAPNAVSRLRAERGSVPFDLTVTNPTAVGLDYPPALLEPLGSPAGLAYEPDPRGALAARRAIAEDQERRGVPVDPERIVLASSTSEAYGFLLKLVCDPGQGVLIPTPSYPLLEHLVTLEGLCPVSYRLEAADGWQPAILPPEPARALIVVHPNNPTGSYVGEPAARAVIEACGRRGMALIADEVFFDLPLAAGERQYSFSATDDVLCFTLGGLSKLVGLPQLKLSWIVVSGPAAEVRVALERLAFIADAYLSVATPVQLALGHLLREGAAVRDAVVRRCRQNLAALARAASGVPAVTLVPPAGGYSAVLRLPVLVSEERLVLQLLEREGVAVLPGYFFDFPAEGYVVLSLLGPPAEFAEGVRRLLGHVARQV